MLDRKTLEGAIEAILESGAVTIERKPYGTVMLGLESCSCSLGSFSVAAEQVGRTPAEADEVFWVIPSNSSSGKSRLSKSSSILFHVATRGRCVEDCDRDTAGSFAMLDCSPATPSISSSEEAVSSSFVLLCFHGASPLSFGTPCNACTSILVVGIDLYGLPTGDD